MLQLQVLWFPNVIRDVNLMRYMLNREQSITPGVDIGDGLLNMNLNPINAKHIIFDTHVQGPLSHKHDK